MSEPHSPIADTQPRPVPPVEGVAPGIARDWLGWAARALEATSDSARADAEILLAHLLGTERSALHGRLDAPLAAAQALHYAGLIERRRQGEPVAYLTGRQGFWTLDLDIDAGVLIPRPDTETLVEWALDLSRQVERPDVLDLGTGSGAIALSLADALRHRAAIHATDVSADALRIARANAARLQLAVAFHEGDWFDALAAPAPPAFDLVLSNPPYIADDDPHLPDLRYEPRLALVSGPDGLDAIRRIVGAAGRWLRASGWLLLEHGYTQGEPVRELLIRAGFAEVQTRRDLGGQERVSGGRWP